MWEYEFKVEATGKRHFITFDHEPTQAELDKEAQRLKDESGHIALPTAVEAYMSQGPAFLLSAATGAKKAGAWMYGLAGASARVASEVMDKVGMDHSAIRTRLLANSLDDIAAIGKGTAESFSGELATIPYTGAARLAGETTGMIAPALIAGPAAAALGAGTAGIVAATAGAAGIQSGASYLLDARTKHMSDYAEAYPDIGRADLELMAIGESYLWALASGAKTAALTAAGGALGGKFLGSLGPEAVGAGSTVTKYGTRLSALRQVGGTAALEGVEEGLDEAAQSAIEWYTIDRGMTMEQAKTRVMEAVAMGALFGATMEGASRGEQSVAYESRAAEVSKFLEPVIKKSIGRAAGRTEHDIGRLAAREPVEGETTLERQLREKIRDEEFNPIREEIAEFSQQLQLKLDQHPDRPPEGPSVIEDATGVEQSQYAPTTATEVFPALDPPSEAKTPRWFQSEEQAGYAPATAKKGGGESMGFAKPLPIDTQEKVDAERQQLELELEAGRSQAEQLELGEGAATTLVDPLPMSTDDIFNLQSKLHQQAMDERKEGEDKPVPTPHTQLRREQIAESAGQEFTGPGAVAEVGPDVFIPDTDRAAELDAILEGPELVQGKVKKTGKEREALKKRSEGGLVSKAELKSLAKYRNRVEGFLKKLGGEAAASGVDPQKVADLDSILRGERDAKELPAVVNELQSDLEFLKGRPVRNTAEEGAHRKRVAGKKKLTKREDDLIDQYQGKLQKWKDQLLPEVDPLTLASPDIRFGAEGVEPVAREAAPAKEFVDPELFAVSRIDADKKGRALLRKIKKDPDVVLSKEEATTLIKMQRAAEVRLKKPVELTSKDTLKMEKTVRAFRKKKNVSPSKVDPDFLISSCRV